MQWMLRRVPMHMVAVVEPDTANYSLCSHHTVRPIMMRGHKPAYLSTYPCLRRCVPSLVLCHVASHLG